MVEKIKGKVYTLGGPLEFEDIVQLSTPSNYADPLLPIRMILFYRELLGTDTASQFSYSFEEALKLRDRLNELLRG